MLFALVVSPRQIGGKVAAVESGSAPTGGIRQSAFAAVDYRGISFDSIRVRRGRLWASGLARARRRLAQLDSIGRDFAPASRKQLIAYCALTAMHEVQENIFQVSSYVMSALAVIAGAAGIILWLWAAIGPASSASCLIVGVLFSLVAWRSRTILAPADFLSALSRLLITASAAVAVYVGVHGAYVHSPARTPILAQLIWGASLAPLAVVITNILAFLVLAGESAYVDHLRRRWYPHVIVFAEAEALLFWASGTPAAFCGMRNRIAAVRRLRRMAYSMEHGLPRVFEARGSSDDVASRFRAMAAHVRGLEAWVVTPKPDTQDHFAEQMSNIIAAVVSGAWDELPGGCCSADADVPGRSPRRHVVRFAKAVMTGLAPGIILWGVNSWVATIDQPVLGWSLALCFSWFCVSLLSLVDPLWEQKLRAARELSSRDGISSSHRI